MESVRAACRSAELGHQPAEKSMRNPTDDQIENLLIGIISDGFNRSLGALSGRGRRHEEDATRLHRHRCSKFYDIVTGQIVPGAAKYGAAGVRQLFLGDGEESDAEVNDWPSRSRRTKNNAKPTSYSSANPDFRIRCGRLAGHSLDSEASLTRIAVRTAATTIGMTRQTITTATSDGYHAEPAWPGTCAGRPGKLRGF